MPLRRTIVVHTRLAGHMARVQAARAGESGVQILTMGQLAARLAGGLLRPIDPDDLKTAVRESLAAVQLGELEPIKALPGMVRAAVGTLEKIWNAGIDLSREAHPRLQALRKLEGEVLRRLPPSMKRPQDLVELSRARIGFAKAVLGPVEIHGHSEMSPCWRPLLAALSEIIPLTWVAGSRHVPDWIRQMRAEIRTEAPGKAKRILYSCAHPHHEAVEAFRWMRALLAKGAARPEEIAIAAASPSDFDDHCSLCRAIAMSRFISCTAQRRWPGAMASLPPRLPKCWSKDSRRKECGGCLRCCPRTRRRCAICRRAGPASCRRTHRSP
jgi:hypothetical protein